MCTKIVYNTRKEAAMALGSLSKKQKTVGHLNVYWCKEDAGYHFGHNSDDNSYPFAKAQRLLALAKPNIEPIIRKRPFKGQ